MYAVKPATWGVECRPSLTKCQTYNAVATALVWGRRFCMKSLIIAVSVALLALSSCVSEKSTLDASWRAYCAAYNVNPSAPTEEEENYYLDCWAGSVEEEAALGL